MTEPLVRRPGGGVAGAQVRPSGHAPARGRGRVLAVWGPTGAPGRTSVAIAVADEAARLGVSTLLADADPYGGIDAQTLGLLDESAGFALACREASAGRLDTAQLALQSRQLRPGLRVLTGIARADRWPELRPAAVQAVFARARHLLGVDGGRLRLLSGAGRGAVLRHCRARRGGTAPP